MLCWLIYAVAIVYIQTLEIIVKKSDYGLDIVDYSGHPDT